MKKQLYIIGVAGQELSHKGQQLLALCPHIFATERFGPLIPEGSILHTITPLATQIQKMKVLIEKTDIAILASGDPLYYGIVRTLLRHFPAERLHIVPSLSSIQQAAARFRLPWDDARLLSLHGRETQHLPGLFLAQEKSIALTDATYCPNRIAREILRYLETIEAAEEARYWQVCVAEDIGMDTEKLFFGTLEECADSIFSPLNVFALLRREQPEKLPFALGLTEEDIQHSRGLITKREVRAATIHALQLPQTGVFWDIGAGSGSIAIEAARLNPELVVYAVEHKEEERVNIRANIRRFRCYNIIPVAGHAPEILVELPAPNRIFVGGSSGTLADIIDLAGKRLAENGRIVINGVISKTVDTVPKLLTRYGFSWESSRLEVIRENSRDGRQQFNPITIFTGEKERHTLCNGPFS